MAQCWGQPAWEPIQLDHSGHTPPPWHIGGLSDALGRLWALLVAPQPHTRSSFFFLMGCRLTAPWVGHGRFFLWRCGQCHDSFVLARSGQPTMSFRAEVSPRSHRGLTEVSSRSHVALRGCNRQGVGLVRNRHQDFVGEHSGLQWDKYKGIRSLRPRRGLSRDPRARSPPKTLRGNIAIAPLY